MIVSGAEFAATLESRGFDFFSGVPCSLIEGLIATLEVHPRLPYVAAPREDVEAPCIPYTPHQLRDRFRASAGAH
jgi:sulfopyruvate decarboxylase TPP-binding subunit